LLSLGPPPPRDVDLTLAPPNRLLPHPHVLTTKSSVHVINRILTTPNSPAFFERLADLGTGQWASIVKEDGGSLVVQHMLESWAPTASSVVAREILDALDEVARTPSGSLCVRLPLSHPPPPPRRSPSPDSTPRPAASSRSASLLSSSSASTSRAADAQTPPCPLRPPAASSTATRCRSASRPCSARLSSPSTRSAPRSSTSACAAAVQGRPASARSSRPSRPRAGAHLLPLLLFGLSRRLEVLTDSCSSRLQLGPASARRHRLARPGRPAPRQPPDRPCRSRPRQGHARAHHPRAGGSAPQLGRSARREGRRAVQDGACRLRVARGRGEGGRLLVGCVTRAARSSRAAYLSPSLSLCVELVACRGAQTVRAVSSSRRKRGCAVRARTRTQRRLLVLLRARACMGPAACSALLSSSSSCARKRASRRVNLRRSSEEDKRRRERDGGQ